MIITSWIERIGRSLKRDSRRKTDQRRGVSPAGERLEERSLLSAQAFFLNGEIDVVLGPADSVVVQQNPVAPGIVQVLINGIPEPSFPTVSASTITKLLITGGDDANLIDLRGVTSAVFNNAELSIEAHGGNGADTLLGSDSLADSLDGGHGADSIEGNGLNDTLLGDDGDDTINGGAGDDSIDAGDGQDIVDGNAGNDTIIAGDGQDIVNGSAGLDIIDGGNGTDTLLGGVDGDVLNGGAGNDSLDGQSGDDSIFGGSGNDTLLGNTGADSLDGQSGNDLEYAEIVGGQGIGITTLTSPTVFSADFNGGVPTQISGTTTIAGVQNYAGVGTGTNVFSGNMLVNATGGTELNPGTTAQTPTTLTLTNLPTHTSININVLLAIINSWDGTVIAVNGPDFFNVRVDGTILFRESFDNNTATGVNQSYSPPTGVQLTPRPFTDRGFPSTGPANANDSAWNLELDPRFQNIPHTASTLTIDFFANGAGFQGGTNESWGLDNLNVVLNGVPVITPVISSDTLLGGIGHDTLNGADGSDVLNGQAGDDLVIGHDGNDSVLGGSGNDSLFGDSEIALSIGTGDDSLYGNSGTDTLVGGGGGDLMDGGAGNDVLRSVLDITNGILITIDNAPNVIEGSTGQVTNAVFTVSLSSASNQVVTVQFATADGSAVAAGLSPDYTPVANTLQFAPGVTTAQILVPVLGDGTLESDENIFVRLTNATNALISDTEGETFIVNDDGWAAMGPAPVTNAQVTNIVPNDEISGAVQGLATHPTIPDIAYVGTVQGGIWKTLNATAQSPTWVPQTDFLPSLSIGDIEFDPTDPTGNTLVAGIGRTSSFAATGGNQTGMLRTVDGGTNWTELNAGVIQNQTFRSVAARGAVIMGASDTRWSGGGGLGLFRSTDSGTTFALVSGVAGSGLPAGPVSDLVGDPNNPSRFYIAVRQQGVFRSDDSGATWIDVTNNIVGINANTNAIFLSVHATTTTNAVYAGVVGANGGFVGLYRSANAGTNWTALDVPNIFPGGQGIVHGAIVADPTNANLVYAAGDRIQNGPFTLDAVRVDASLPTGSQITSIVNAGAQNTAPHADSRRLVFTADGNLLLGGDGGIYRRANPSANAPWTSLNSNLQTLELHDATYDTVSNIIFGGAQDNGTNQQTAAGSLTWEQTFGGDGGDVAVDTIQLAGLNRSIRYSSAQNLGGFHNEVYDATNNLVSQTFLPLTVQGNGPALVPQFITPVATNEVAGNRLIIGGANATYESLDGGLTMTVIGAGIAVNTAGSAIAYGGTLAGAAVPAVVYVGSGNQVFVRSVQANPLAATATAYPGGRVGDIVLDPTNWQNAYVISANGVFNTPDGGTTWNNLTGNLVATQLRTIEYIGGANPAIVAGTLEGVFRMPISSPGVWAEFGATSLPNAAIWDLDYDAADDILMAGTMGRGAWIFANVSAGQQTNNPVPGSGGQVTFVDDGDTMIGSDGDDFVVSSTGNDIINAGGGNDVILAGDGNDSILGGSGSDSIDGQAGDDTLSGQGGKDTLIGGDGNDTFQWNIGDGDDVVSSLGGFDQMQVTGTTSADTVSVGKLGPKIQVTSGSNVLTINADIHVVTIDLGNGNDLITVGDLSGVSQTVMTINGGDGNDTLDGSTGVLGNVRLRLNGDAGNDRIVGSTNDDTIDGGDGRDALLGGNGNDSIFGGADNDAINGGGGDDSMTGDGGNDTLAGSDGNDTLRGGLGNDSLSGQAGADSIDAAEGRDTLLGGDGNDSLDAGGGKDYVAGGEGDDTLDGGRNDDTILGENGADTIRGNHGNDSIDGGAGNDTIAGGDGNDSVTGGDDNDLMTGSDGDDVLNGAAGNDTLTGSDGSDILAGGSGNDLVLGDDGNDTVKGNGGTNTLAGGQGTDSIDSLLTDVINENFVLSSDLLKKLDLL